MVGVEGVEEIMLSQGIVRTLVRGYMIARRVEEMMMRRGYPETHVIQINIVNIVT